MARFQIWGRVEQVDLDRFMVVASAVGHDDSSAISTFVITDRATDAEDARGRLKVLVARLDARVRAGGNIVSDVDIR